jgi:hypothetical protein
MLFLWFFLVAATLGRKESGGSSENRLAAWVGAAIGFQTLAIAWVLMIFQARYLAPLTLLWVFLTFAMGKPIWDALERRGRFVLSGILILASLPAAFALSPTHFGYFNLLRNSEVENENSKELGALEWTWSGAGESSYLVQERFLRHLADFRGRTQIRVVFDYFHFRPFHVRAGVEFVDPKTVFTPEEMRHVLGRARDAGQVALGALLREKIDYLILSKVRALTVPLIHHWAVDFREHAVFREIRRGVEYAWVFRVEDLMALEQSDSGAQRNVRASQSSGKKRFDSVARR